MWAVKGHCGTYVLEESPAHLGRALTITSSPAAKLTFSLRLRALPDANSQHKGYLGAERRRGKLCCSSRFGQRAGAMAEVHDEPLEPGLVVFSGGTAFNSIAGSLRQLTTKVAHVLPVSDDGGSTAEIVRVLGGPAVGDIRSRCLRLADDSTDEAITVKALLAHRLSAKGGSAAKAEWTEIVEGEHPLWTGMSDPYKHTIRAFLVYFHTQILRHSTERFNFSNGSVGNFFFAGARLFLRSLEAAIFMFARVACIPEGSLVLPAIRTEERIVLGAQLADGTLIRGQNAISHPSATGTLRSPGLQVDKTAFDPMPSPVKRVFYLSADKGQLQHEVWPEVNKGVLDNIASADAIVYGIGSLYTSICPSLVLQGVGEHIAARSKPKIFLVNGSHDRETTAVPSMLSNLPHLAAAGPEHFSSVSSHLDDSDLCPTSPHNLTHGEATSAPAADSYSTGAASHRLHRPASRAAAQNGSGQHSGLEAPKPAGTLNDSCSAPASGATGAGSHAEPISGQEQAQLAASPGAAGFTGSAPGAGLADVTTGNSQTTHAQQQTAAATQAYSRTRPLHVALPDESPSAGADSAPDSTMHSDRASSQGIRQMTASDMVLAICDALNRTHATDMPPPLNHTPDAYVTTLIAPRGGAVALDRPQLERLGIRQIIEVASGQDEHGRSIFDPEALVDAVAKVVRSNS